MGNWSLNGCDMDEYDSIKEELEEEFEQEKNDLLAYICEKYNISASDMSKTVGEWENSRDLKECDKEL